MAQMKEQIKAPEIIQLSNEEIANLSDAQFKTLVIRMLTELVEFGHKLDEKMKAMLRERKLCKEPIVMGRKLELKSTLRTRRKKEKSNQKRMKKQEFKKNRRGLGNSETTLNALTSEL